MANATFLDSHAADTSDSLGWAMDLTPLIRDPALDLTEFTLAYITRFQDDVVARIAGVQG